MRWRLNPENCENGFFYSPKYGTEPVGWLLI